MKPVSFDTISMTDLRRQVGTVLDSVRLDGRSYMVTRKAELLACVVPVSYFMPDIRPGLIELEVEAIQRTGRDCSIAPTSAMDLKARVQVHLPNGQEYVLVLHIPHGYPNNPPTVRVPSLPDHVARRFPDGSLCLEARGWRWNPGRDQLLTLVRRAEAWLEDYAARPIIGE